MNPRGRPRIGAPIMVRFPDQMLNDLDTEATRQGVTRAELIRAIIGAALEPPARHTTVRPEFPI